MKVTWLECALDDVEELHAYLVADDPGSAAIVVARIENAVNSLADLPNLGQLDPVEGVRRLVVPRTPYLEFYRVSGETVFIIGVRHGARLPPRSWTAGL